MRKTLFIGLAIAMAALAAGPAGPAHAGTMTYLIQIDTTAAGLAPGDTGGFVDLQLSPASPQGPPPSVTAVTSGVSTDGTLGSVLTETGTASGSLPGPVTIDNTMGPPNELTQGFTVGSFFDIFVTFSGSEIGPGSSVFSGTTFGLLVGDSTGAMTGATGYVNPNFPPTLDGTVSFLTGDGVTVTAVVPEPSASLLMGLGLAGVVGGRRLRNRRAA